MYDDTFFGYIPETKKDDNSNFTKPRQRESLLKQPNGDTQQPDQGAPFMETFREGSRHNGPPAATLLARAKSYSNFYDAAIHFLETASKEDINAGVEVIERVGSHVSFENRYKTLESDLLDASQDDYILYARQLALSERHIDNLLDDTTGALELLTNLSESFQAVELQTTAFQAQCEGLLAEQKRLRDLAEDIGVDLQYYTSLESLTRRLNAPGAGQLVKSGDFLEILKALNTFIYFFESHPGYRDSTIYKTRYISLLQRCLNLVQNEWTTSLKFVTDNALEQLKSNDPNETLRYILFRGKFEDFLESMGPNLHQLLRNEDLAVSGPVFPYYKVMFQALTQAYIRSRESLISPQVSKDLQQIEMIGSIPEDDFLPFTRRCISKVFERCYEELSLMELFFRYRHYESQRSGDLRPEMALYNSEELEQQRLSYIKTLHNFLLPHLNTGNLERICGLINVVETTYLGLSIAEREEEMVHQISASELLEKYLYPLCDELFIKAARSLQQFKPSPNDLRIGGPKSSESKEPITGQEGIAIAQDPKEPAPSVETAYPCVTTAVRLLIMYNESNQERQKSDVIYEILDQTTESLRIAATAVKNQSGLRSAQIFLIKNLILVRNILLTHEIPDSTRRTAELDFSPIWATIGELQARKQLFNPLAYVNPLVRGQLLPAVVDRVLDARKKLESLLAQQITEFTKYWQKRLKEKGQRTEAVLKARQELEDLLDDAALEESTKEGIWRIIKADEI